MPSRFLTDIDKRYYVFSGTNPAFSDNAASFDGSFLNKETNNEYHGDQLNSIKPISPEQIKIGMQVRHPKFGKGKVLHVQGTVPDTRAIIFFENAGEKTLLLKFAKLTIVNTN